MKTTIPVTAILNAWGTEEDLGLQGAVVEVDSKAHERATVVPGTISRENGYISVELMLAHVPLEQVILEMIAMEAA